ncbi:YbaN family protein [Vagococcus silagei]|uniref:DUF454 domain-containing protein n=1 Tax=Vagococcus silagei TaxID=2508885 RepID=A0A4V3TUV2_9ENTE|nr:YbaN family protein [Vagococcus silagei]THB60419.1 DUF454 domain-containing protein [Vagococcus silagei]
MKKFIYFIFGGVTFILGTIGIFLPILPTVPFYLASGFFWVRSSDQAYQFLLSNKWYQQYVTEWLVKRKMTVRQRIQILLILFVLLAIPFIAVPNTWMRLVLGCVFIGHCIFFIFFFDKKRTRQKISSENKIFFR